MEVEEKVLAMNGMKKLGDGLENLKQLIVYCPFPTAFSLISSIDGGKAIFV